MVFYRKYRPQNIEELDSKEIREKLIASLSSKEISHAFLFTGPKGLGKTSTARIVAKSLNCGRKGVEPCNKCEQCMSITSGTNMDILEIDGASNRGIDEIRDLREKVKLSPMSARKKVYIIDEVHMLTTEAFNALLKTLEEPPSHVVFILCTTEPHKVPETILSRCLRIQFKKATNEELVRSFERIIKKEGITADKEALNLIAGLSDGSFRDGVKILEEMVLICPSASFGSAQDKSSGQAKTITKDLVEQKYQISSIQYQIAQMIRNFENKDTKNSLEGVVKIVSEGIDVGNFMQNLIETLHNSLLLKAGVEGGSGFVVHSLKLEIEDLKRLIELLSKAHGELKYAVLPQIPLELAIVEWGISQNSAGPVRSFPPASAPSANAQVRAVGIPSSSATRSSLPATPLPTSTVATQQDISKYSENDALWTALIDKVKAYNHSVAGVLRGCRIKSYDNKTLLLETSFKFHKDKLSELKTKEMLDKAIKEVTKKNVRIEVELKKPA